MIAAAPRLDPPPQPGPATPVHITPQDFHAAAQRFVDAANDLERIRDDLLHALSHATGAAGGCDGAKQYNASWGPAIHAVLNDGFDRTADLLGTIGQGIDLSARNHWTADAASAGQAGEPPPWSPVTPRPLAPCIGAPVLTGDPPWWMPGFLAGYIPTADTGRLDAAAGACRAAAKQVGDLVSGLHSSLQGLLGNNTSEDLNALEGFWQQAAGDHSILAGLPQALSDLATSLDAFITWNNDTQDSIQKKIESVIDGLGAVVAGALAIGSVLTDGGLDVVIVGVIEALEAVGIDAEAALAGPIAEVAMPATVRLLEGAGAVADANRISTDIQTALSSTPNPNVASADATKISDELTDRTEPTHAPDPNALPRGLQTIVDPGANDAKKLAIQRENESATTLSMAGYDVEQNPSVPGAKNPDYRVNGEIFDCVAPSTPRARNIASRIEEKVNEEQADRIVLNMSDTSVGQDEMRAQLHNYPIQGLKEVISIDKQGNVTHLYP